MQAYMQLVQSFLGFQMAHNIWLPTWNSFPTLGTSVGFHFQENMITHFKLHVGSILIEHKFSCLVLGNLQILLNLHHFLFHFLE
jgi:hypothetical protein